MCTLQTTPVARQFVQGLTLWASPNFSTGLLMRKPAQYLTGTFPTSFCVWNDFSTTDTEIPGFGKVSWRLFKTCIRWSRVCTRSMLCQAGHRPPSGLQARMCEWMFTPRWSSQLSRCTTATQPRIFGNLGGPGFNPNELTDFGRRS